MNIFFLTFKKSFQSSFLTNLYYYSSNSNSKNSNPLINKLTNRSILILHGPDTFKYLFYPYDLYEDCYKD
jgi:hypothetical protein